MAITEGTQPAPTHPTGTTTTTAAFTPEANSLLIALVAADGLSGGPASTATVSDSLSGSWTLLKRQNSFTTSGGFLGGTCEVWIRDVGSSPSSMTVTASGWNSNGADLTVRTLIGALPVAQQTGATGSAGGVSIAPTVTLTPTQIGSRIYGACLDYFTNTTLTVNSNTTSLDQFPDTTNGDTWATFKSSADTSSLTSTTYGYTDASNEFQLAAVEILAAATYNVPSTPFHPGRGPSKARFFQPPRDTTSFSAALTDTGSASDALAVVDVTVGASSPGGFHPGRGPTFARFYQTPRSTDLNFQSIALTDSGTGDDQISVTATVPLADAATAVDDSLTIAAAVPLVDAGSGVDQLTVADVTVGAQAPTPLHPGKGPTFARFYQTPRSTDVVTATPISLTDTGSGSDALTVSATVPLSDTATGDDQIAVTATVSLSDTAAGADALTVVAALGLSEAAAALDALNVQDLTVYPASAVGGARHPGRGPTNARFYQTPRSTDLVNIVVSTPGTITAGSRSATLGPATAGGLLTNTTSGGQA